MAGKKISGLAAAFDLESYGLDPIWGMLLCGVVTPWGGQPKTFVLDPIGSDDSKLVTQLVNELSQYSILIAHNGVYHDRAFLNARALHWGLPILDPFAKMIDPLRLARRHLNCGRNSLDALAQYLSTPTQKLHLPPTAWQRVAFDHDPAAMDEIIVRCKADVQVLLEVCERVLGLVGTGNFWGSA